MAAPDTDLIKHLNTVLKCKLTGINQYFLHARLLKHQGHVKLADYNYKASIDAMKFSDMVVEHILSLGGMPNLQELGSLHIGETPAAMLANDLVHAESGLSEISAAVSYCKSIGNQSSVELLGRIMDHQQEHVQYLRGQLSSMNLNPNSIKDCA
jgi:bacterioferritin